MGLAILSELRISRKDALRITEQVILGLDDDAHGTLQEQTVWDLLCVIGDELNNNHAEG